MNHPRDIIALPTDPHRLLRSFHQLFKHTYVTTCLFIMWPTPCTENINQQQVPFVNSGLCLFLCSNWNVYGATAAGPGLVQLVLTRKKAVTIRSEWYICSPAHIKHRTWDVHWHHFAPPETNPSESLSFSASVLWCLYFSPCLPSSHIQT